MQCRDKTDYYAVLYGSVVLACLIDDEYALADISHDNIKELITLRSVRGCAKSTTSWETHCRYKSIVMKPLYEIDDETYTVYFQSERLNKDK